MGMFVAAITHFFLIILVLVMQTWLRISALRVQQTHVEGEATQVDSHGV